jgi:hypothetical protein
MNRVYGVIVFVAALFSGIGAAAAAHVVEPYLAVPEIEIAETDPDKTGIAPGPQGIYVMYAGIRTGPRRGDVYLRFLIHNGTDHPLGYVGYSANHSFPFLKANGKELPDTNYCWNGSQEYTIPPGRSTEVYVGREEFLIRPSKNARISTGFQLRLASTTGSSVHYSEPFLVPEEFRSSIDGRDRR